MSRNDITNDEIKSKISTKEYEENFDKIFRNNKRCTHEVFHLGNLVAESETTSDKPLECSDCFCENGCKKERNKAIAQNGNVGYDIDSIYQQVDKDYREK